MMLTKQYLKDFLNDTRFKVCQNYVGNLVQFIV